MFNNSKNFINFHPPFFTIIILNKILKHNYIITKNIGGDYIISDIYTQLENGNLTNKKLLDYIISIQLQKIEKYNNEKIKPGHKITEKTELAMSNLIELLKIRHNINSDPTDISTELIDL